MVFDYILYSVAFLGLLVGSYTDLKTREVPDWISYGLIFSGLGLRLIFSLTEFNWSIFFEGLIGFLVFVALAYLMYYLGQWGGGDAKLLMGLGAIIGLGFDFSQFPQLAVFLINLALVGSIYGSIYGVGWLIYLGFKNKKKFTIEFKKAQKQLKTINIVFLTMAATLIAVSFFFDGIWRGTFWILAVIPIGSLYTWTLVNLVEKVSFYKTVRPEELTEGDWIAKDIMIHGEKICGPRDLGISEEQISKLVELKKKKKLNKILIKEGIPFVPSFLLGFGITIVWGSWFLNVIL